MSRLFVLGGPYMYVLSLLATVVLVLAVKKAVDFSSRTGSEPAHLSRGMNAILFWGCISAVLGFLGQFSGHYLSLMAIRDAGLVNPAYLAEGIAVSLIPTVFGLMILALAAIVWFGLKCRLNTLASRADEGRFTGD
jgi:biopolymer transport protein ExbB/TolQ